MSRVVSACASGGLLIGDITMLCSALDRARCGIDRDTRKMKQSLWQRIRSWFRRAPAHVTEVEVSLQEPELFDRPADESGVRPKPSTEVTTVKLPALKARISPFDAATRKVDTEELARVIESSSRTR